ncbi:hypothetical protein KI387_022128, partial [Taxus chinensis]
SALGVTLDVLGLGDGGDEIGLEDRIVLGLVDEGGKIELGVNEEDEVGMGATLYGLGLAVGGDDGDLGITMDKIVLTGLGVGDGRD